MKLYKITGNCGWLIYSALGKFDAQSAENVYKNHFNQSALMKNWHEVNYSYPNVIVASNYN